MKIHIFSCARFEAAKWASFIVVLISYLAVSHSYAGDAVELKTRLAGDSNNTPVLEWHASVKLPFSASYTEYTLQRSADLSNWVTVGSPIQGSAGIGDEVLRKVAPTNGELSFYRVIASAKPGPVQNDAAGMYGYADAFSRELQQLGQLPLEEFAQRYGAPTNYIDAIDFDVTKATFWPEISAAAQFTSEESAVLNKYGFMVSPRLGSYSFGDAYYKLFTADLPVFVSTDAILQAWHRSYTTILEEQEILYLAPTIQSMLNAMAAQIPTLNAELKGTALEQAVIDADFFIAVARSLISGNPTGGSAAPPADVQATLNDITALQAKDVRLFARSSPNSLSRTVDFSRFKPRGH